MSKSYDIITEAIVSQLEAGTIPWKKPWHENAPANLVSKKEYRGINVFMLACQSQASKYWLTYRQAKGLGGHVRQGEKSTPVVFWRWFDYVKEGDDGEPETKRRPMLKYYRVFNVSQCDGLDESKIPSQDVREFQPIDRAEQVAQDMPQRPIVKHGASQQASYSPLDDIVNMPVRELFKSDESYYCTLFHELGHATGHESRLKRLDSTKVETYGGEAYSKEELIAEMSAAYICGHCAIEQNILENSAAYIRGWLSRLRKDSKLIVYAAASAQKAADFILDRKFENGSD